MVEKHINISKYKSLSNRNYIKLSKGLNNRKKGLINIQDTDDEKCLKWFLVWHLHPVEKHLTRIDNNK